MTTTLPPQPGTESRTASSPLTREQIGFLVVAMGGSLLVGLSAQFASSNIADLQGGLVSTPDEASWVLTVYAMAGLVGVVTSGLLIKALSVGRYMLVSSILFAASALACAIEHDLRVVIWLRVIQGFAAGGFGPAAFFAVFVVAGPGGRRLPFLIFLLAFLLLVPSALGPTISGAVEERLGWRALFVIQAGIGTILALGAYAWVPRKQPEWSALISDWVAVILLATAVATLILVLSQGTRRFWFQSDMIAWSTAACIGAVAGFAFLTRYSPMPTIAPRLLLTRKFGVTIGVNLVFRAALAAPLYLVPQFLAVVQGYRPLEIAKLVLWAAIPQLLALPLVWRLIHIVDPRAVMALGLALCAVATALCINVSTLVAAEQFRLTLVLFAVGELLFLSPALIVGSFDLKLPDLPTASLFFNLATLGGTTMGVGLVSHFVGEREKFHSSFVTEHVSLYNPFNDYRVARLVEALPEGSVDESRITGQVIALIAGAARREAWALAFADAFLVVAMLLLVSAFAVVAIGRSPALRNSLNRRGEEP